MSEELEILKDKAETLGITYHPNIGIEALRKKINDKLAEETPPTGDDPVLPAEITKAAKTLTKAQAEQAIREKQWKEQMAMVRIRIACLNPVKKDLQGEIIVVSNRYLGTVRKFIPFGEATDNGYHVPVVLYNELRTRKFNQVRTRKVNGQIHHESKLVPEFAIEVLDPLTQEELNQLARQQAAAQGL